MSEMSGRESGFTLTVLGCGTMGIAIMSGIIAHLEDHSKGVSFIPPTRLVGNSTLDPTIDELPQLIPSRFIACVRRKDSAKRIKEGLAQYQATPAIYVNENLKAIQEADIVLLGCKPQMFKDILGADGIKEALAGKLLISILAGVTVDEIEHFLYGERLPRNACRVVRAMPNAASFVRESMTVIATSSPPLSPQWEALITWIFTRIGRVVHLPPDAMDASTALCGSGPAFAALVLEALADGGVAMGIPRAEAQLMAAQVMMGTAGLVINGQHPANLREKVSTPGGCTINGLLVLEEGRVRGSVARAIREATFVASQLGRGVIGLNGTGSGIQGRID